MKTNGIQVGKDIAKATLRESEEATAKRRIDCSLSASQRRRRQEYSCPRSDSWSIFSSFLLKIFCCETVPSGPHSKLPKIPEPPAYMTGSSRSDASEDSARTQASVEDYEKARDYYIRVSEVLEYRRETKKIHWSMLHIDNVWLRHVQNATEVMNLYEDTAIDKDRDLQKAKEVISNYLFEVFNACLHPMSVFHIGDLQCFKRLCDEHQIDGRRLRKVRELSEELEKFERQDRNYIGDRAHLKSLEVCPGGHYGSFQVRA